MWTQTQGHGLAEQKSVGSEGMVVLLEGLLQASHMLDGVRSFQNWTHPPHCLEVSGAAVLTSFLGDSGPGPRAHVFDQLSRTTRAWVRGPAETTRFPVRLGPVPEGPRGRQAILRESGQVPRPTGSTNCPGQPRPESEAPWCRPAV